MTKDSLLFEQDELIPNALVNKFSGHRQRELFFELRLGGNESSHIREMTQLTRRGGGVKYTNLISNFE